MIRNTDQLQTIFPASSYPGDWVRPLNQAMHRFDINTPNRAAAFLGQIGQESGELNNVQENLNYSPQRLVAVWPSRFPDVQTALAYARNPEKLANNVYGDRLGNTRPGDGFLFRGRGLIQITGRANYQKIAKALDLPGLMEMPDSLLEPKYAALSAAAYWYNRKLNAYADQIDGENLAEVVEEITRRVNGGTHGLDNRIEYTKRALETLTPPHEGIGDAPEDWLDEAVRELS